MKMKTSCNHFDSCREDRNQSVRLVNRFDQLSGTPTKSRLRNQLNFTHGLAFASELFQKLLPGVHVLMSKREKLRFQVIDQTQTCQRRSRKNFKRYFLFNYGVSDGSKDLTFERRDRGGGLHRHPVEKRRTTTSEIYRVENIYKT